MDAVLPMSDGMILQSRSSPRPRNRPVRGKEARKYVNTLKVSLLEHWHYGLRVLQCRHARQEEEEAQVSSADRASHMGRSQSCLRGRDWLQ